MHPSEEGGQESTASLPKQGAHACLRQPFSPRSETRAVPTGSRVVELSNSGRWTDGSECSSWALNQSFQKSSHPNRAAIWVWACEKPDPDGSERPTLTSPAKTKPVPLEKMHPAGSRDKVAPIHGKSCCPTNGNSKIQILKKYSCLLFICLSPNGVPGLL